LQACNRPALLLRVLWEIVRYDAVNRVKGFAGVRRGMRPEPAGVAPAERVEPSSICRAIACMSSFYWKPLLCFQRSVVMARVMRAYGTQADVVIGYRANPFLSHAWVEIGGRVVDDSPAYQTKMQVLDRF
jgi:Transglutaminase-like superfamily